MFILGVGSAYPEQVVSNDELVALGLSLNGDEQRLSARCGIRSRRVSLPLAYVAQTRNCDVVAARNNATIAPSALAFQAVGKALSRAGISLEQVGLILADTATPDQTCPSEAQRIGGILGVTKVPTYDVVSGSGALVHYLEMISQWKPERVPDYVLCVSTNTPSQHVSFSSPALPAYVCGDAAAAVVISPRHRGKLRVIQSRLQRRSGYKTAVTIGQHVEIDAALLPSGEELTAEISQGVRQLVEQQDLNVATSFFVGPQLFAAEVSSVAAALGFSEPRVVATARDNGYSFGAATGCAIDAIWDVVREGESIAVLNGGDGLWSGSLLLSSEAGRESSCCIS